MHKKIKTLDLISFLKDNRYKYYSISLIINNLIVATHTISYRKFHIYDEDIFDNTIKWTEKEFLEVYNNAIWCID